jgi:hypothetical protein
MHQRSHRSPQRHDIRVLCHHIFPPSASGPARTCGSPALRGQAFCFYHNPNRKRVLTRAEQQARDRERRLARRTVTLPLPRNGTELLHSLHQVASLIAANQIDLRRAGLLLEALKTAGSALRE